MRIHEEIPKCTIVTVDVAKGLPWRKDEDAQQTVVNDISVHTHFQLLAIHLSFTSVFISYKRDSIEPVKSLGTRRAVVYTVSISFRTCGRA
jgi:hypothetical protein